LSAGAQILGYELRNLFRSRWVVIYGVLFLLLTDALFRFGGSGDRVLLSLTNVVLLLIPLVAIVFGTMHLYHAREFIQLMLAQPVPRLALFAGLYGGLAVPLATAFVAGVGVPFVLHGGLASGAGGMGLLLVAGVLLTLVFTALAFLIALRFQDRATGLGAAIVLWLGIAVIYDGLVLLAVALLGDWPLERPLLAATFLNPVDLGRVLLVLRFDLSALSGYTGAVFARFFGSGSGLGLAVGALALWAALPLIWGGRRFARKDF
jgi:Cu-processing system permease protein